jgi:hypothetical protein
MTKKAATYYVTAFFITIALGYVIHSSRHLGCKIKPKLETPLVKELYLFFMF